MTPSKYDIRNIYSSALKMNEKDILEQVLLTIVTQRFGLWYSKLACLTLQYIFLGFSLKVRWEPSLLWQFCVNANALKRRQENSQSDYRFCGYL